ncbi:hypothetical protein B0I35DRAFT_415129 [Stachybotrys elegans]|uniref:Uncharacterized protein n=1 Tax=Stachybotrys elegans TaxID=80388 RepID=A0A8K0SG03_9HYPO|nr:hypothetical protein B0I35DRAFT_415129 [Stachybotrys elegans]
MESDATSPSAPPVRVGYIRTITQRPLVFNKEIHGRYSIEDIHGFFGNRLYQRPPPAPQQLYVLGILTPDDDKLLDWLIDQSRPLQPDELEKWKMYRRQGDAVRLSRRDFQVYLTRSKAKSEAGRDLIRRLHSENVECLVLSPSEIEDGLRSVVGDSLPLPDAPAGGESHHPDLTPEEKELDDYLMFVRSDYLIDRNTPIYSRAYYQCPDDRKLMSEIREGVPERSEDRDVKFDYSTHHRCTRDKDMGVQWRCACGGSCKRNKPCKEGLGREDFNGYTWGRMNSKRESVDTWKGLPDKGDKEWLHLTAAELCSRRVLEGQYGFGRQGNAEAEKKWKETWVSRTDFSGDWVKE